MAGANLNAKEHEKLTIIQSAVEGKITNAYAAKQLNLSVRQIQRLKFGIKKNGSSAIVHKLKGKSSNHQLELSLKEKAIQTVREKYSDFKPTFASEKLKENHDIDVNPQTLRRWMHHANLWKIRHKKQSTYFAWRPRKEYFGQLQQFDGSYHYWFEDRFVDENGTPIEVCLLASIDDATGKITQAYFDFNEGVVPVFTFWKNYIETIGKPISIYLDKFSTYKINHKLAVDNFELMTQFQRAMRTLGIELVPANSPQAKGRIERLFQTLQDRLVKEMRLAKINTPEEGNRFLQEVFIPKFNKQFAVVPTKVGNIHKQLSTEEKENINHILSIHYTRRVNNDFTIQFQNNFYQLTEIQPTTVRPQEIILVETWLDGTIHMILRDQELKCLLLPEKPKKQRMKQPVILTTHTLNWKPPKEHPWRKFKYGRG